MRRSTSISASRRERSADVPVRVIDIDEASLRAIRPMAVAAGPDRRAGRPALRYGRVGDRLRHSVCRARSPVAAHRRSRRSGVSTPPCSKRLPDNDEIFAQSIAEKPVVLGFGLSNEGNYRPPVKAGFAFTGESPSERLRTFTAATPLRPQLEANAAGHRPYQPQPGRSFGGGTGGSAVPDRRRATLSKSGDRGAARRPRRVHLCAGGRPRCARHHHHGQDRRVRRSGDGFWRTLALCQPRQGRAVHLREEMCWPPTAHRRRRQAALEGSIVFVGTSAAGLQDIRTDCAWGERARCFAACAERRADTIGPFSLPAGLGERARDPGDRSDSAASS